jgi:hypothetical protein
MPSKKQAAILMVISFLILALLYSSFPRYNRVSAYRCENFGDRTVKCCQTNPDGKTAWCTTCDKTDPPSNCSPRFLEGAPNTSTPPPTSVLPPPSQPPKSALPPSTTCPDGSVPDGNGNCPTTTTNQNLQGSSSPDNQGQLNNINNNNPQSEHHHKSKSNDLLGQIGTRELATKKGNNNDNSPTPPACPDKGPIPPDCTLKPKF